MNDRPTSNGNSGRIGFVGMLFLVFLVLKLTHYIDWSWWWITAPLWGSVALSLVAVVVIFLVLLRRAKGRS